MPADVFDLDGDGDYAKAWPIDLPGNARRVDDPNAVGVGQGLARIVDMGARERQ
ncbi:MAG: hypothetical protein ACI841_003308 [Planctomycetota bacterium]